MEARESPSPKPRRKIFRKHDGLLTPRLDVSPSSSLAESDTSSSEELAMLAGTPRGLSPARPDSGRLSPVPFLRRRSNKSREGSPDVAFPPTYSVIRFAPDIRESALAWLIEKIRSQRRDGGAELLVRRQPFVPGEGVILHISASKIKFLEVAEEMELKKKDRAGLIREFTVAQMEEFLPDPRLLDSLLTTAERQTIVRHELENIRALPEDQHVPGYPANKLYEGQSIIQMCLHLNLIECIYPLHEREALEKLGQKWYKSFSSQPFEEIRLYFGEAVALYFNFLGFYTLALVPPMILGILQLFLSTETLPYFCVFNVLWVTIFLEVWKRKSNSLAFSWGTLGMTQLEEPRPNFHGHMQIDEVTGRYEPQFPKWKTYFRMYCVSLPIVGICMMVAFIVMLGSFWAEEYVVHLRKEHLAIQELSPEYEIPKITQDAKFWSIAVMVPSVVYAGFVFIMNSYYRSLATMLTEWENHRTQAQFERHRVTKLVLFEFVNNFVCMFYIAFYIQDMDMLRQQLAVMLIILQAINNIQEAILPLIIRFYTKKITSWFKPKKNKNYDQEREPLIKFQDRRKVKSLEPMPAILKDVRELPKDDPRIALALEEGQMDTYEGTYDDYLELFIQFGYVFLFSSVYPLAAFWAVVNNILEIRSDAFKLCKVYQRPMARRVKDTGAWQRCFEALGAISVMTNCGLLCLSPRLRKMAPELTGTEWVLLFVGLEHGLLVIRHFLNEVIPDHPEWVRIALNKIAFQSRQALKHERLAKSKKQLTRKYKSVHGPHKY